MSFNNVRMLLLSGIGKPYDPAPARAWSGATTPTRRRPRSNVFFDDKMFNPFIGAGALGESIDDFNGDNFDHRGSASSAAAYIGCNVTDGRPIENRPDAARHAALGRAMEEGGEARTTSAFSASASQGALMSYRGNYLDLDPTYRDRSGRPLLRMTFDFTDNEHQDVGLPHRRAARRSRRRMNPSRSSARTAHRVLQHRALPDARTTPAAPSWATDPKTSVVNKYLQSWDVPNVFVDGRRARFRRTPATTRPARSARWPIGRRCDREPNI